MWEEFAKELKALEADVPKIFKKVAGKGAVHAENYAQDITDQEGLVDTGAYKKNWNGEQIEPENNVYGVMLQNSMEYASWLEDGHKLRNGKRWTGKFVGRRSIEEAAAFCYIEMQKEIDKAFKKYRKKYHKKFTK